MSRFSVVTSLALASLSPHLPSQISASFEVTSPLTSTGFDSCSQASYSQSVPAGPLTSPASLTGFTWTPAPGSLTMSSSGTATICSFQSPPGSFGRNGTVRIDLTAPFTTTCEIRTTGTYSATGAYGSTNVSGAVQANLGGFFTPVPSVNQVDIVTVGPAGTSITVQHATNVTATFGFSSVSTSLQITWAALDSASTQAYGTGCLVPGPVLTATALPRLGTTMTGTVSSVPGPNPFGVLSIGFSDTASNIGSLPAALAGFGMTNCWLLQSAELSVPAAPASSTSLDFGVALPADPVFVGVNLFTQAFCLAPGANPLQALVSDGERWQLGT